MKTKFYRPKVMKDSRAMLNLACGNRIHKEWTNLEYYKSIRAFKAKHPLLMRILYSIGLTSKRSFDRYKKIDKELIYADLKKKSLSETKRLLWYITPNSLSI